jgi:LmbE family N-acetylglucosaminyl deacetylase
MSAEIRAYDERPERLLVIVAHPDDAELSMAGTVARWVAAGTVAQLVCCTSGDAGADDARTDPLELAATREAEQRAAAEIVGYEDVTFMHRPDGALANDLALREQLVRIMRTFRPDGVAAFDPRALIHAHGFVNHVDHRAAGAAALDAVSPAARNAMAFPHLVRAEGLEPHRVGRLYLIWSDRADIAVDISDTLEVKLRALDAHASQRRAGGPAQVRRWAALDGAPAGLSAAETFALIELT